MKKRIERATNLAKTWEEAECVGGKSLKQAIDDLNKATKYKADYVQVMRWKSGERNPQPVVRRYMLGIVVPYAVVGITDAQARQLADLFT